MDRKNLMQRIEKRAFDARITLNKLCALAGLSGTIAYRWTSGEAVPSLESIGKMERAMDAYEQEHAA